MYINDLDGVSTPQVFYTYFYIITTPVVSALKKQLYLELPGSADGNCKPLLDPGGGFNTEAPVRRFQKRNGRYKTVP